MIGVEIVVVLAAYEVSTVNDDEADDIFREPIGSIAQVNEDVARTYLLVSDYRAMLG